MHMLKWHCAHAQLEACTCSTGSMSMNNWKCAHAQLECAHAEVKVCVYSTLTGSVHMLNWKRGHAQVEVCTCFTKSVHIYAHMYTSQLRMCTPPVEHVHIFI